MITLVLFQFSGCSKDDADKMRFLNKGNQAFTSGNSAQALKYYDEALVIDSAFVDVWFNKGLVFAAQASYDEAIYAFSQAIQYKPTYYQPYLSRSNAHLAVKQYYGALEDARVLQVVWSDSANVDFLTGLIYTELKQYDSALHFFHEAGKKDPSNSEIQVNMGNVYYHMNMPDSALVYLKTNTLSTQEKAVAYNTLALISMQQEQYERSLSYIDSALTISPGNPYFLNNKGLGLLKAGGLDESEKYLNLSMRADPYNAWVYRNKGLLYLEKKEGAMAVRMLLKAYGMDDELEGIHYHLAKAYFMNDQNRPGCEQLALAAPSTKIESLKSDECD